MEVTILYNGEPTVIQLYKDDIEGIKRDAFGKYNIVSYRYGYVELLDTFGLEGTELVKYLYDNSSDEKTRPEYQKIEIPYLQETKDKIKVSHKINRTKEAEDLIRKLEMQNSKEK